MVKFINGLKMCKFSLSIGESSISVDCNAENNSVPIKKSININECTKLQVATAQFTTQIFLARAIFHIMNSLLFYAIHDFHLMMKKIGKLFSLHF